MVSGSEVFRDHYTGSDCKAVEEPYHHEDETSGGCYACQSLGTQGVAYDERVGCIVKLLEEVPQKKGKREFQDFLSKASLCEIKRAGCTAHAASISQEQGFGNI